MFVSWLFGGMGGMVRWDGGWRMEERVGVTLGDDACLR